MPENPVNRMINRGILTTEADYWVHLFPLEKMVYWYRVEHMLGYIKNENIPVKLGKSADGTPTGNGYIIPKEMYFIQHAQVPGKYINWTDWTKLSDSQRGFKGELVIGVLIEHRVIGFPPSMVCCTPDKRSQYASIDFRVQWTKEFCVEAKVETIAYSQNLFVQTHEGGHKVNLVRPQYADKGEVPF